MKIEDQKFVAIDYTLTLDDGKVMDQSEPGKPLCFLVGAGQIIPGLEKKLQGMSAGEDTKMTVEAVEGYGERRDELVREFPRSNFPSEMELEAGMVFQADGPQGPIMLMVKDIQGDQVVVDLNHPLAGERLHFDVKVVEVRDATEEEKAACAAEAACGHSCCSECGEHQH